MKTHALTQDDFQAAIIELHQKAVAAGNAAGEGYEAKDVCKATFRLGLPMLTSRRSVQLYLACACHGRNAGFLNSADLKECLHVAQLSLTAFGAASGPEPQPLRSVQAVAEALIATSGVQR